MLENLWAEIISSVGPYVPRLAGAIVVLAIGAILAHILSGIVRKALLRTDLDDRLAAWFAGAEKAQTVVIEEVVSRGFYYLVMAFVLIAVFQVLGLTFVSQPLNALLTRVFEFVPRVVSAGLLLAVAWVLATGVRAAVIRAVSSTDIDRHVRVDAAEEAKPTLPDTIGEALYWFIFLLFIPGILGALALEGMMQPVQEMVAQVIGFLPNLFTAALTLLVGWIVARIVQKVAAGFLAAIGLDALTDRMGLSAALGGQPASRIVGVIVYVLVFIPILISALTALRLEAITGPLSGMLETVLDSIPSVFGAILVLGVSYGIGRIISELVTNVLSGIGFNAVLEKIGLGRVPPEGTASSRPSSIVGSLVLTAIMLLAAIEAAGLLGFDSLSAMIREFLTIAGHVVFGIVLFGVGLFAANFVAEVIAAAGAPNARLLGRLARVAILVLAGGIALRQMGLANEIVTLAFGAVVGAIAVALAIAFGVGGRDLAARHLDRWVRQLEE